jgi:hypothetical protein
MDVAKPGKLDFPEVFDGGRDMSQSHVGSGTRGAEEKEKALPCCCMRLTFQLLVV